MSVPFLDLAAAGNELRDELDAASRRVIDSGWFILGGELEAFEREFAAYCGARHAIGVGNGLDALAIVLRALGVEDGDEVIVPGHTFIATWLAVTLAGGVPRPVDVDDRTMNLSPACLDAAITDRTRVVMPVHMHGLPADMERICAISRAHGARVVEDAAQAHGATIHGRRAGSLADAAAFSFYPTKNLGGLGDAGCIVTDDDDLAERVRLLRNYGSRRKYHHEVQGGNSRLDEIQAAFLRVKLARLDEWNARRRLVAERYLAAFADLPDLRVPEVPPGYEHVWHVFPLRCTGRDELQRRLADRGIGTLVHYPVPVHRSPAYAPTVGAVDLPVTDSISATELSLPMGPHLALADVDRVIAVIRELVGAA